MIEKTVYTLAQGTTNIYSPCGLLKIDNGKAIFYNEVVESIFYKKYWDFNTGTSLTLEEKYNTLITNILQVRSINALIILYKNENKAPKLMYYENNHYDDISGIIEYFNTFNSNGLL